MSTNTHSRTFDVGTIIAGSERFEGDPIPVANPARVAETVGTYREGDPAAVAEAVESAVAAQSAWARESVAHRSGIMRAIATAILEETDALATCLAREVGTPLAHARGEVGAAAAAFANAADAAADVLRPRHVSTGADSTVRVGRRPLGVVACIVPWNAPVALAAQKLAPALVTGNAVVLKPSPLAPLAALLLVRIVARFVPSGVVSAINGAGGVGAALIEHPSVRKVSFTGGGATARSIMTSAAASLTKVHFELGGNDPALLLDDVDIEHAAERIAALAYRRAGQICYAVKRVYVPAVIRDAFLDALTARVDEIAVGDPFDERTTMGPLGNAAQRAAVTTLVEEARSLGREVRTRGSVLDESAWDGGHFLQPVIVADAAPSDRVVLEEQFGPVLPVVSYTSLEHAIEWANATEYGLASSVWSSDIPRAVETAERIHAGVTFINDHVLSPAGARSIPFGGVKQSGMGWENSPAGLEEYLDFHSIDIHQPEPRPAGQLRSTP